MAMLFVHSVVVYVCQVYLRAKVAYLADNGHAFRTLSGRLRMPGILRADVACLADNGHAFRTLSCSLRMSGIL